MAMKYDVAIIGGGASGLACAVRLLRRNPELNIAIIDAGERLGKKLAATGNGQGNVTNAHMSPDRYFSGNPDLVEKIAFSKDRLRLEYELFNCILQADDSGRVYPAGKQASALVDSLLYELRRGRVTTYLSGKVINIDGGLNLTLESGEKISAKFVAICVGGKAQKQFKTDGSSYDLVRAFGHTTTPLYPSLVQLKTAPTHIKNLKGIRADCEVTVFVDGQAAVKTRGDVIFTDCGVSGNAVFAASPYVAGKRDVRLSLSFLHYDDEKIADDIEKKKAAGYPALELLSGTLHNQIGRAIIRRCSSSDTKAICAMAKNFILNVTGTLGFDYAQVTRGGIDMSGVTDELESRYIKNLFFAGEVLDVDGCCGGYNLHWAFASGFAVADGIIKRV